MGSRRSNPSVKPGQKNPIDSNTIRSSSLRDYTARIAGHLFRHSCDYQLVLGMLHAWNSAWCKPPLGYRELNRIIDRIANREAARIEGELERSNQ